MSCRYALLLAVLLLALAPGVASAQPFPTDVVWSRPAGEAVRAVAYSPDGQRIASGATRAGSPGLGRVDVFAALDGAAVASAVAHTAALGGLGPPSAVAFRPDGLSLASAHGVEGCATPPCSTAGAGVFTWAVPGLAPLTGRTDPPEAVRDVAFAPGAGLLGAAYAGGPVRLLDPVTLAEQRLLAGHAGGASAVAFSPDGALAATVGADGMLRVWDVATGAARYAVAHGTLAWDGPPVSVAFSPDGALIATGSDGAGPTVRVWEAADGAPVHSFVAQVYYYSGPGAATSLAFSPNGRYLLAGLTQEITYFPSGATERLAGLWFWDLVLGDEAALYVDESAPEADGVTAVALSAAHDHRFAYALGGEVKVAETPLSLALPVVDEGVFTLVGSTLPQGDSYESVAPADYDGDGDLDLLVVRGDGRFPDVLYPELYRNDGTGGDGAFLFTRAPFPAAPYTGAVSGGDPYGETLSWADYDNDGDVDALVATAHGTTLYRNDGGVFTDSGVPLPVYEEFISWGFAEPTSSAWADYDNDGDLDLALPETAPGGPWPSPDSTKLVLYNNDGGTLTPTGTRFPLIDRDLHVVWGDVESDGDLDLLYLSSSYNCSTPAPGECLIVYENDGGALTPRPIDFPEFDGASADFGDFDLDGDLDILLVARLDQPTGPPYTLERAFVYRNEGDTFAEPDTLQFPFSFNESFQSLRGGEWADYDSDGDVDIVIAADVNDYGGPNPDFRGVAFVFANTDGAFSLAAAIPSSESAGTRTWADLDGDGDLDYLTTGSRVEGGPWVDFARIYRNDVPESNSAPTPPPGLVAVPMPEGIALSWGVAADDHTPADALTYNLWVTMRNGSDIVSPMSRRGGRRMLPEPGNVSLNQAWTLRDLPEGTYEWRVQAVDNAFNGGAFADGGRFTVGAAALAVTALPLGGPVTVPASGGTFRFRAAVTNQSAAPQTFRAWTEARSPDGQAIGPLFGPAELTLAPGETYGPVLLEQAVPASAPAGRYVYGVRVGGGPSAVVASGGFAFEKAAGPATPVDAAAREAAGDEAARDAEVASGWTVLMVEGPPAAGVASSATSPLPGAFALVGAHPNPVRVGAAVVRVDLPGPAAVTVRLYDVLGREVWVSAPVAVDGGAARAVAIDVAGLAAGAYVYRVEASLPGGVERASGRLTVVW